MDVMFTFVPLLIGLAVPVGVIICVWLILRKGSSNKDLMLQQLMTKNKELEAKIDKLLERKNVEENIDS